MYELIYIHPRCVQTGRDAIVPMGILAMLSGIKRKKLGMFEAELTDGIIADARIFLLDIHWHFTLHTGIKLAARIRRLNPDAKIIAGGYTASVFAEQIVRGSEIDYVVRGDAEEGLPRLISVLLDNGDISTVPNLTAVDFQNDLSYAITQDAYSNIEFEVPEWFPSFVKCMKRYQKNFYPTYTYPFVPVARGCYFNCESCYGNPELQRKICGRSPVFRDGDAVARDLRVMESIDWIRLVYIVGDMDSVQNMENARKAFSGRYKLNLYYEYYNNPEIGHLDMLSSAFEYLFACIFTTEKHLATDDVVDMDEIERAVAHVKGRNVNCTLFVNPDLEKNNPGYAAKVLKILRKYGCDLYNMKSYILKLKTDIPFIYDDPQEMEQHYTYHLEKNSRDNNSLLIRRKILHRVFFNRPLTSLARKAHTLMTEKEFEKY